MNRILLITSSPRAESISTRIAHTLAEKLASRKPNSVVAVRNLVQEPLRHIDDSFATARNLPAETLTPAQKAVLAVSDDLVKELLAADSIIMAAGMINFGIPSNLKSYIDHIVRPGVTFTYTDQGPLGMVKNKKVYLVLARGGFYTEGPMQQFNFQDTYLRAALGFIGLNDFEIIAVEGVAFGPDVTNKAVDAALAKVSALAA